MPASRVEPLAPEAARTIARDVNMLAPFAELNIFRVLLHRPKTAKALSDLLVSLLFQGVLDARLRELVILRIGWTTGSDYEWTQHWRIAQETVGCTPDDLLAVRDWRASARFGEAERTVLAATDELLATGTLDDARFAECVRRLGRDATVELVAAVGTWRLVSKLTRALAIPLEDGVASWPPDGAAPGAAANTAETRTESR